MFEVWHYEKVDQYDPVTKTGGLFTEYINKFMKLKQVSLNRKKNTENPFVFFFVV